MRALFLFALFVTLAATACSGRAEDRGTQSTSPRTVTAGSESTPTRGAVAREATPPVGGGPTGSASGPAEHDGARAMAHLRKLADEPRVSGTAAEQRGAEYIAEQLRAYGYTVEVMAFDFDTDPFRAGEVRVEGASIEAVTLAGSPGGKVRAPSIYVGVADEVGIGGRDLSGRVAVADRGTLNFGVKYENVKAAGAIGLVVVNNRPGWFSGNLTTGATIPVVGVTQEEGRALVEAAKDGREVEIDAPPTAGPTGALNVIARAAAGARCTVLVGGHFDTVPSAPGANDNASGVANTLELARALAADGLDEGLCFAAFGAEESGLNGSKALVADLKSRGALPAYMVNLDVTGIGGRVEVIGTGPASQLALRLAKEAGIEAVPSRLPPNSGSDHQSFADAGVETVYFTSGDFSTIHSPEDVAAAIDQAMLDRIGDSALLTVKALLEEVAAG